ncbi:MAG: methyl-accepting chemotaxis protein [Gammaproteobacteria bacterium]|nr:methyl-accepting chemotaxis protein [Gammaproteobacteria bacterium]
MNPYHPAHFTQTDISIPPVSPTTAATVEQTLSLWFAYRNHPDVFLAPDVDVVSDQFYDSSLAIHDTFSPLSESIAGLIPLLKSESEARVELLKQVLAATILGTLLVAGFAWLFVRRNIVLPVTELALGICKMSKESDLTQRVKVRSKDEIGQVAANFNNMSEEFRIILGELMSTADRIDEEVESLSSIATQTKEDVAQQHVRLENVATGMNQLAASAESVIDSTGVAVEAVTRSSGEATRGQSEAGDSTEVLGTMVKFVRGTSDQIQKLEQDAQSIGAIVDAIRGIAEQTNLLALNAAIEAVRAGEQGRGFAVVADEVRNLAQSTQKSTGEIQEMIGKLQENTQKAVTDMSGGEIHANDSASHMEKLFQTLSGITQSIEEVNDLNGSIAVAAREQGEVSNQMSRSVTQISDAIGQSSHYAEKTAVTSTTLAGLSSGLRQVIHGFKI